MRRVGAPRKITADASTLAVTGSGIDQGEKLVSQMRSMRSSTESSTRLGR